jgi:hypothetical protein
MSKNLTLNSFSVAGVKVTITIMGDFHPLSVKILSVKILSVKILAICKKINAMIIYFCTMAVF